jgi:DNA polymerase-3 subunit delta
MIIKSYELENINKFNSNLFLLYGQNEGFKNDIIKKYFIDKFKENIFRYDEKEILDNKGDFFNGVFSKSFFEEKKLLIISRATDKLVDIIEEILEKKIEDIKIVLNASSLEKKSKLRKLFEKNKSIVCIAIYEDNIQTLSMIARNFFKLNKIPISQEIINLLIERSRGDRGNLTNEMGKIESYIKTNKNISPQEIFKLTNLAENYSVSELLDSCLSKNSRKTITILNENSFALEDCILIIRSFSIKLKRLYKIHEEYKKNKNLDSIISSYKPPIFWKDKDAIKKQINLSNLENIENMIFKTNDIELLIKKNSDNAVNILSDFIINTSRQSSNEI